MSGLAAHSPGKRLSEILISITSSVVFFFLDILDVIMCVFFRLFDELLEGKSSPCYCMEREDHGEDNKEGSFVADGESRLSDSLRGRKNFLREMGLLRIRKNSSREPGPFCVGERNRWSDCGCESCVSWMSNGSDFRLHIVVEEEERARMENNLIEKTVQNDAIFIHGFLSSSSLWTENIFPNLSEHAKKKYRLFAADLLGFGKSPKPRDCFYTLSDHLEMIEKSIIRPFQVHSFHLVAHSMGCIVALALAAKYSESVKSVTLIAPPYFSSAKGNATSEALSRLTPRRVWPPMLFGSAFMTWYEHLGRCVCFFLCRNHRIWEWILKLLTGKRDLHFSVVDLTRHTHHSAWHTMHNVVCGGAKFLDNYLETLRGAGVSIRVIQGSMDQVVPVECSFNMKMKAPQIELETIPNANHNTVILGRAKDFTSDLESLWASIDEKSSCI